MQKYQGRYLSFVVAASLLQAGASTFEMLTDFLLFSQWQHQWATVDPFLQAAPVIVRFTDA